MARRPVDAGWAHAPGPADLPADLAFHPDGCTCPTHASIRRFLFDFEPAPPLGIPTHRINRNVKAMAADSAGHLVDPTGSGRGRWTPDSGWAWKDDGTGAQRKDHLR